MKIVGFHSGHDSSYSILDDGIPVVHNELERFNRRKNSLANSIDFFLKNEYDLTDIKHMSTHRTGGMIENGYLKSFDECQKIIKSNRGNLYVVGHHQSHAANSFFTSDYKEALIVTIDGGGIDNTDGSLHKKSYIDVKISTLKNQPEYDVQEEKKEIVTSTTFWLGNDNKIKPVELIPSGKVNLGKDWSMCTSKIFGLGTWKDPRGDQAGTVMGMAALGNPEKYMSYFENKLTDGLFDGDGDGSIDFHYLKKEADKEEQNRFDISASLQKETEKVIRALLTPYIEKHKPKNLCLSGGVSLNCVSIGKMLDWFPGINIFVDPIPYDAGLSLGSSRYVWHHILDNPRIYDKPKNWSPYLGYTYSEDEVKNALKEREDEIQITNVNDEYVIDTMIDKKIISVFGGGSESGRRALGNRSILADPTHAETKDIVNEKVKHRQWFRPFAPSILREDVKDWFIRDIESPYMSFVLPFKEEVKDKVPAVVHLDGTGRLQTVTENNNKWYYNFIKKWKTKTGVPIILNTSFNDREPIVETPEHAINCFVGTNIDYLYFSDYNILVKKKK